MADWAFDARSFSDAAVREAFRVWGFVVIRGVLDSREVRLVREELDRAFGAAHLRDLQTMCFTETLKHEEVWSNLFRNPVVKALRAALGPQLYYQNDLDVQRNSYGSIGARRNTGWHMDAGSETGQAYLQDGDYRFAKCGIYLQDSDNGWGGGIRVKPKSHRGLFDRNYFKRGFFILRRVLNRVAAMMGADVDTFEVPTRAGDLCFFDSRLLHSSVPPSQENIRRIGYDRKADIPGFWPEIPAEHTKYVIYWDGCNAAMVADFLQNSIRRAASELPGMREEKFKPAVFTRILSVQHPENYPGAFVAAAREKEVGIATLDTQGALLHKQKLQSMQLWHP